MVIVKEIHEIRPKFAPEFTFGEFKPRTQQMAEAYQWGKLIHGGQKRLSGEPYFETHCGWVAAFVDNLVHNEAWTIAALLHDAIEDSTESLDRIREKFPGALGEEVAHIVDGVTKISHPRDGRSRDLEALRRIAMFRDPGTFIVKLADKTHNVITLSHMNAARRAEKAEEAIRAYGKLAGILNCYTWRRYLEDTAFPHYDFETFSHVKAIIDRDPRLNTNFINQYTHQLGQIMAAEKLDGRVDIIVNGYWQAWQKLRQVARMRKASLDNFTGVNDLVSFRLILSNPDPRQCYILLAAINRHFGANIDQSRFDDFIAYPQNGYQALQVTAWIDNLGPIEIAIATEEMEGENLWGIVYAIKNGKDIRGYLPVEILTPTGGARFVPEGASVLDAVASIQREFLLDKISSVKVNGFVVQLSDKVTPGDVVRVITSGQRLTPSEEWLKFCNRSTAALLRAVLATEALRRSGEQGTDMVKGLLSRHGLLALEDVEALERDKVDNLLERLSCASLQDFYSALGGGAVRLADVERAFNDLGISKEQLGWTTISITGSPSSNRPGVLALMAKLVSEYGGNILRSVNNTSPDGSFTMRLVVKNLSSENQELLLAAFRVIDIEFDSLALV